MANLSPAVLENMKRIEALNQKKVEEKDQHQVTAGKGRGKQIHDKLRYELANQPKKKVPKKKKPKPKTSKFDFFNRGSAGKTFDWDAFWKKHGLKKPEKKDKADAEAHPEMSVGEWMQWYKKRKKKKAEDTPYYDLLSDKPKKKKKPAKVLYRDLFEKAEENQFGAWGQRGLGDGNGTGARQDGGDTHLITPVKEEKLNELMRGLRYMPRSVSRKRKK